MGRYVPVQTVSLRWVLILSGQVFGPIIRLILDVKFPAHHSDLILSALKYIETHQCFSSQLSIVLLCNWQLRVFWAVLMELLNCCCFQKLNDESIMRSLLEIKTPIRSIARSYILTTPESSNIGILEVNTCLSAHLPLTASPLLTLFCDWVSCYQGDWVWLKKIPVGQTTTVINQNTQTLFSQV